MGHSPDILFDITLPVSPGILIYIYTYLFPSKKCSSKLYLQKFPCCEAKATVPLHLSFSYPLILVIHFQIRTEFYRIVFIFPAGGGFVFMLHLLDPSDLHAFVVYNYPLSDCYACVVWQLLSFR